LPANIFGKAAKQFWYWASSGLVGEQAINPE